MEAACSFETFPFFVQTASQFNMAALCNYSVGLHSFAVLCRRSNSSLPIAVHVLLPSLGAAGMLCE